MPLEHHPLNREFSEFKTQLHALLSSDGHFVRLAEEYEELDKRIYEVESGRVASCCSSSRYSFGRKVCRARSSRAVRYTSVTWAR